MKDNEKDFYIGYLDAAPRGIRQRMRIFVLIAVVVLVGLGVMLSISQMPFGSGKFEFRQYQTYAGVVLNDPHPRLLVERPGDFSGHSKYSSWLLVAPFKFGADQMINNWEGQKVSLQGALIYRDGQTMLELKPGSIQALASLGSVPIPLEPLGKVTLEGEIVDSKCYLGVMKPGSTKTHRACAIRCISGGIPPLLVVKSLSGTAQYYLLTDQQGEAVNKRVLNMIAVPVRISGNLYRRGEELVLRSDPSTYQVL